MSESLRIVKNYIAEWDKKDGKKECNNQAFIDSVIEYLASTAHHHWEFRGENGYCGRTAIFREDAYSYSGLWLEFAYCDDGRIVCFTGRNNGFWVPEYLDVVYGDLWSILMRQFLAWGGFVVCLPNSALDRRPTDAVGTPSAYCGPGDNRPPAGSPLGEQPP